MMKNGIRVRICVYVSLRKDKRKALKSRAVRKVMYKLVECSPNIPNGLLPQNPITSLVYYLYKITREMFSVEEKKYCILLIKLHIFKKFVR